MNREARSSLKSFIIELLVYAVLVLGYFFLVLHFLGERLYEIFERDRRLYAAIALALIVGQGILLEALTTALLALIKPRMEDE